MKHAGCIDCGKPWKFTPSLKDRGMTFKEAKFLFIDSKGGRCTACYIAHNKKVVSELIAKATPEKGLQFA